MKQWLEGMKNGKKDAWIILLLFGILLVVITWPSDNENSEFLQDFTSKEQETDVVEANAKAAGTENLTTELEARLEQILSQVDGIGETKVMITLKSDGRKVVEKDTAQSEAKEESAMESESSYSMQAGSSESTIYEKDSAGNETPFVTEELAPEIQGVLVIAQGAKNSTVAAEITEAVMALFGVEAHKIKVMKME
ncbi:MAG: stage III sporulation protein AG [Clostridiales bacterium]|nr:stage III sporulation protein AG [Clostridiales bacterium]